MALSGVLDIMCDPQSGWMIGWSVESELVPIVSGQWLPSCHVQWEIRSNSWTPDRSGIVFLYRPWRVLCVCVCRLVLYDLKSSSKSVLEKTPNPHASWVSRWWVNTHIRKHMGCLQGPTCPLWNVSKLQRPFTNVKGTRRLCVCVCARVGFHVY